MKLYECHICKKKSPYEDDLEECGKCKKIVCIECSTIDFNGNTICKKCDEEILNMGIDDYY